jgi:hypothetical protein
MQILRLQNKGTHLNTIERFYTYTEYTNGNHLNDDSNIFPNKIFDTLLKPHQPWHNPTTPLTATRPSHLNTIPDLHAQRVHAGSYISPRTTNINSTAPAHLYQELIQCKCISPTSHSDTQSELGYTTSKSDTRNQDPQKKDNIQPQVSTAT